MTSNDENKNDFQIPVHIAPRIVLFLLTVCCICSMGFYYFKKENIVSVSQAAGLVLVPLQKGINQIGEFFFDLDQERLKLDEALAKIESLEAENEALNDKLSENDRMIYEYKEAMELLELKDTYSEYDTVGASVIFSNPSGNWYSTFTIDKGSEDGIEEGMNVLADGGLAGYVDEVGRNHAIVSTIINDNTNVSGMQLSTRDSCMVIGDFPLMKDRGMLRLDYMSSDFDMSKDRVVVTSQISDRYLPGIVIGYIEEVSLDADKLTCSGYLRPAVDFEHMSHVLVITTRKEIE